jgi:hypothetical protein
MSRPGKSRSDGVRPKLSDQSDPLKTKHTITKTNMQNKTQNTGNVSYHELSDAEMARIGGSEGEAEMAAAAGAVIAESGPAAPEVAVVVGCAIVGYEVEKMLDAGIAAVEALWQEFTTGLDADATQARIDAANGKEQPPADDWGPFGGYTI